MDLLLLLAKNKPCKRGTLIGIDRFNPCIKDTVVGPRVKIQALKPDRGLIPFPLF